MTTLSAADLAARLHGFLESDDTDALAAEAGASGSRRPTTPATPAAPPAPPAFVTRPNGEKYYIRSLGGTHDDVAALQKARQAGLPVLMYGAPGCGKTALFEAAFTDADGKPAFEYVPGSGDTMVADFIGGYVPVVVHGADGVASSSFKWVDGPLVRAMDAGVPLLVDEVALIDPKVMAVVYSVMDGRAELNVTENPDRGIVHAAEGFVVFGACNPNAPGARMSEALISRFAVHVEVTVDLDLMGRIGVPAKLVSTVANMATKFKEGSLGWYPQIREMLAYSKVASAFGEDAALANLVSQAPESDRPMIADILSRNYGRGIKGLNIK